MANEQARPLTAEEIAALRAANVASPPSWLIPRLLATIAERDTTLDAWRPVLEAVANGTVFFESPRGEALLPEHSAQWVDRARRVLGEES